MFFCVGDRPFKSGLFSKGNREKRNPRTISVYFSYSEETIKIFVGGNRERCGKKWNPMFFRDLGGIFESEIIAFFAFFSSFFCPLESPNSSKKLLHIVGSFDPSDSFYFTYLRKCLFPFLIFASRMNIRIIPECEYVVFFFKIKYRNRRIRTTTHMEEELWFLF